MAFVAVSDSWCVMAVSPADAECLWSSLILPLRKRYGISCLFRAWKQLPSLHNGNQGEKWSIHCLCCFSLCIACANKQRQSVRIGIALCRFLTLYARNSARHPPSQLVMWCVPVDIVLSSVCKYYFHTKFLNHLQPCQKAAFCHWSCSTIFFNAKGFPEKGCNILHGVILAANILTDSGSLNISFYIAYHLLFQYHLNRFCSCCLRILLSFLLSFFLFYFIFPSILSSATLSFSTSF